MDLGKVVCLLLSACLVAPLGLVIFEGVEKDRQLKANIESGFREANVQHTPATEFAVTRYKSCISGSNNQLDQCVVQISQELSLNRGLAGIDDAKKLLFVLLKDKVGEDQ
jgi:hypothetical protein